MSLNFKRWLLGKLGGDMAAVSSEEIQAQDCSGLSAELYIRELAFWSCVNTISNAVSKCEFKTFSEGKAVKGPEWYLWNIEPNRNQCSSAFLHKLISQLYRHNEALVVELSGQLLVADSFARKPFAVYDDVFTQVQVGDLTLESPFFQSKVLYFQLGERNMRQLVNGLYEVYRKLIDYGMRSYRKSRGTKGVLEIDTVAAGDPTVRETYEEIRAKNFKTFADAENGVLSVWKGMKYSDLGSKTYSNEGTRDIRAMIDDVMDFTARAFGIHPALLSGDVQGTKDALEHTLTFCIDPLCDMIQEEINRKRYGQAGVLAKSYIQIDTKCIKHVDLLSVSTAIDKLISSGVFCINDILELVGNPPIDETWADKHFMTKNYETVSELLNALSGETQRDTG